MKKSKFEKFKTKEIIDNYIVGGQQSCSLNDTDLSGQPDYQVCRWDKTKTYDVRDIYMCKPNTLDYNGFNAYEQNNSSYFNM
jgi:hypothetical protein